MYICTRNKRHATNYCRTHRPTSVRGVLQSYAKGVQMKFVLQNGIYYPSSFKKKKTPCQRTMMYRTFFKHACIIHGRLMFYTSVSSKSAVSPTIVLYRAFVSEQQNGAQRRYSRRVVEDRGGSRASPVEIILELQNWNNNTRARAPALVGPVKIKNTKKN